MFFSSRPKGSYSFKHLIEKSYKKSESSFMVFFLIFENNVDFTYCEVS